MLTLVFAGFAVLWLAPGVYTAMRLHARYGWAKAVVAGVGVTVLGVVLLLSTLVAFTPFAIAAMAACLAGALRAYDDGRLLRATSWASAAAFFAWCAGWRR